LPLSHPNSVFDTITKIRISKEGDAIMRVLHASRLVSAVLLVVPLLAQTGEKLSFKNDIAPVLAQKCVQCHAQTPSMANLDLRTRAGALKGGQHGPAIVPGSATSSHLYMHLTGQEQPQMPMGGRLTEAEIAAIKSWIDGGAEWDAELTLSPPAPPKEVSEKKFTEQQRKCWAFQKVVKPAVPAVKDQSWVRTPVDAFILAKLEQKGLQPNPAADKVTLIRRATFDLTGLPPSPEEVSAFVADQSADAFEKVVDRLLASSHYGERWGRHWLDLARYADTAGFKGDETRPNMWRYRDYVIRSFNEDKPYDRFIKEQIAGDELYPSEPAAIVATGFNRLWPDESNLANPVLRRQEVLNDITDTVASVFMGLTYGCARCHDHKFDPILQKDYYRLQAFFAASYNNDRTHLLAGSEASEYQRRYSEWDSKTHAIRAEMEKLLASVWVETAGPRISMFPKEAQEAVLTPPDQRTPMQWQMYYRSRSRLPSESLVGQSLKGEAKERYATLKEELAKFDSIKPPEPPLAEAMIDEGRVAPATFVLSKGVWDAPTDEVKPGFLTILDPATPAISSPADLNSTGRRSVLANWLADGKNPLTTRVMANRIWHYHFGRGVAGTPSDFGMMGERPTDPQLLDYLASTFVENGWSIKKMHRLIMLSNAYRQSTAYREDAAKVDPGNRLWWRFERRRLEGEVIRDSMLYVSGLLNMKPGGPGIFPPLPPGVSMPGSKYLNWSTEKDPEESHRRSVYIFVKRNLPYPMFESFDFPDTSESCSRRYATVSPTQPLALMNDEMVVEWSRVLAGRVLNDSGLAPEQQVDRAFRVVFDRQPKDEERRAVLDFLNRQSPIIEARLAQKRAPMPSQMPSGMSPARAAAFVEFCHAMLNSNEFLYMN
jgi:hypothetical protein